MSKCLELKAIWCYSHYLHGFIIDGKFYSWDGKIGINYKTDQTTFRPSKKITQLIESYNLTTKQQK